MSRRPRSLFLGGSSVESLAALSVDGGEAKKKKSKKKGKGGLFSRFAASVSSLASSSPSSGGRRDAAAQTPPPPARAHKHTQTGEEDTHDAEQVDDEVPPNAGPNGTAPFAGTAEQVDDEVPNRPRTEQVAESEETVVVERPSVVPFPLPAALMRTDSPLRHSPKTVHFVDEGDAGEPQDDDGRRPDADDDEWPPPPPEHVGCSPSDLEGLEDLLRNLDIFGGSAVAPRESNESSSAPANDVGGPVDLGPTPAAETPSLLPTPPAFFLMASTRDEQPCSGNRPENDGFEFHPPPVSYSQKSLPSNGHAAEGGASVLLEERVTRGAGGAVVVERVFGLPVREEGREEVRVARFVPAPPKYAGIGPTDPDGLPLAPRQMVQKEHDWYKSMFKTLHPTNDDDDEHPVVVRYGSSPEPEKSPEKAELCRTSPRIEHFIPPTLNNTASPPPSKTEVDVRQQGGGDEGRRPRATALFPFLPNHENELPLSVGDAVWVCRRVDANWLEGEHRGRRGIFPANHVKVVFPDQAMCGRILHDFQAQSPLELSVEKDEVVRVERCSADADWWAVRGEKGGRGLVPAARLRLLDSAPEGREEEVRRNKNTLIEPLMCVAVWPYAPAHPDELELRPGDRVRVVERCGDGWCAGTCARTRATGLFPGNYVEPLKEY